MVVDTKTWRVGVTIGVGGGPRAAQCKVSLPKRKCALWPLFGSAEVAFKSTQMIKRKRRNLSP